MRICVIEGCNRKYIAKNFCKLHYQQKFSYGYILSVCGTQLMAPRKPPKPLKSFKLSKPPKIKQLCPIENCNQYAKSRNIDMCDKHYQRMKRHGSPYIVLLAGKNPSKVINIFKISNFLTEEEQEVMQELGIKQSIEN